MSASDKKRVRKAEMAELLTERQRKEKAEAKKLKVQTITFVTAMILVVCIALGTLGIRAFNQAGIVERTTIAATVGDHKINSIEMNYFYKDAISSQYNQWYQQYPENTDLYIQMLYNLDLTKSLAVQPYSEEEDITWAEHFIQQALDDAKSTYAIYDKAMSENFKLSEEKQAELNDTIAYNEYYASMYGYSNVDSYLRANYGNGASTKSYNKYLETLMVTYAYSANYAESLEFDDTAIRDYDTAHPNEYDSFSYSLAHLNYSLFLGEGTKDEKGNVTHTDEEKDAARAKAKEVADALALATSEEELKTLISELDINAEKTQVSATKYEDTLYSEVMSVAREWISSADRAENETTVTESTTGSGDDKVVNGYYVVMFHGRNENKNFLTNVRHLLVKFEGGTKDKDGNTVYSDAEKATAKAEAEGYLKTWQEGEKTEESFIELVKKHSDDSSKETGGLFENISPASNYVKNFLNWSIDPARQVGDAEVIESEYGYHVMYFDSYADMTYRDTMINATLESEAYDKWYKEIVDAVTLTEGDTSKLPQDIVLSSGSTTAQ